MLLWGGVRPSLSGRSEVALADGAAYQPATRTWRPITPAPLAGDMAVWTGTELLVWGGTTGQDCVDACPRADGLATGRASVRRSFGLLWTVVWSTSP